MLTTNISLQPDLVKQINRIAQTKGETVEEFIDHAVREHLERLEEEKLQAEAQAFAQLHPQLVPHYLGQFVAIFEGQLVDNDKDFETLFLRIQKKYKDEVVLIRQVMAKPTIELRGPSPRLQQTS